MHNLAIPCTSTVKESFKRQVAQRAAQRGRWLSVAGALREALVAAGYDLSEPKPQAEQAVAPQAN